MMNKRTFWTGYIAGLIFAVSAIYYYTKSIEADLTPEVNLHELQLTDLEGQEIKPSEFKDKAVVINFWATWCKPCVQEFPYYEKAAQQYPDVLFIMISDESEEKITDFVNQHRYPFRFLKLKPRLNKLGISAIPLTFFINKDGKKRSAVGSLTEKEILKYVRGISKATTPE
jgi:thiol-disulfide isomerase/thioredoxin